MNTLAGTSTQSDTRTGGPAGIPWKDLASNIISRHGTDDDVLDNNEMATLKDFVSGENISLRHAAEGRGDHAHSIVNGYPLLSDEEEKPSSLVEYITRRHGTAEQKLTDGEIDQLQEWFRAGGGARNERYE